MSVIDVSVEDVGRRAGPDVDRHRFLCRRELRDHMRKMIAEVSFLTMGSNKRRFALQLPVLEEHSFEYSHRREIACCGDAPEVGSVIRKDRSQGGAGDGGGGAPLYETHVDLDTIREFLFEDLELPNFLRKQLRRIKVEEKGGVVGVTRNGPMARLHRRASVRQRNRRVQGQTREGADVGSGFVGDDLRFKRIATRVRETSNAVCIFMMDVSGSMGWRQKYLCRAFFWLLNQFVRTKYENVEVVYIIHHSAAREVDEDQFFHTMESGGTSCSSAYHLALEIIAERFPVNAWNVYAFHMSDGDNWGDDNTVAAQMVDQLCKLCNLVGYGQVSGWSHGGFDEEAVSWSGLFDAFLPVKAKHDNMALVQIRNEEDIYPQFRLMLEGEKVKGGSK